MRRLLVHGAQQVVVITSANKTRLSGAEMNDIEVVQHPGGTSLVVDSFGKIEMMGSDKEIRDQFTGTNVFEAILDATGMCVVPGFVDAHTHPIWSGDRVNEFVMKLAGATYLEIHESGGGIYSTVEATRNATDDELLALLVQRLTEMMHAGTTTVECKSGYGLDAESEMRLLRIIERAKIQVPIEIVSTFCGAHAVPKGMNAMKATAYIVCDQLSELARLMETGEVVVENIDVFCEKGVFNIEQSQRILEAGKELGLRLNFHGDELNPMGSAEMGAKIGATAISHLEEVSEEGIAAMAKHGTIAIMLPTTAHVMRLKSPPARALAEAGVALALGSDFNPNAFCLAMPLVMNLACTNFGMSMSEAMASATLNAAAVLGRGATHGSIQPGKFADMVIFKAPRWEHIIYRFGQHQEIIQFVIKKGIIIYNKDHGLQKSEEH